jgi:Jacalin-like lectin domain
MTTWAILLGGIAAAEARDCKPEDKILPIALEVGGSGGIPFDDRSFANTGEITKIEIWAEGRVDAIKVTYGESGFALRHGGGSGGGIYHALTLKPGEYITEVTGRKGNRVDELCFSVNGQPRTCYGSGNGADFFQISSSGRPLRSFNGRGQGEIDRIGFSFGNRASIDVASILYDNTALDKALALAPTQIFTETISNPGGVTGKATYSQQRQLTHTETISWNNETAETDTHSVGTKFAFGKKDVAQAEFSYQYQHSDSVKTSRGKSNTTNISESTGWSVDVNLEAGKSVRATSTWKNVNLDVPFSYDLIYWNDKGDEVCRQKQTGQLRGVSSFGLSHKFERM